MNPLFGSVPFDPTPPELDWRIPKREELLDKTLMLCGKAVCLKTHRVGRRTLPCAYCFPSLGWECPNCERAKRNTSWVPVIKVTPPQEKWVIMGGETTAKSVEEIRFPCVVEVRQAKMLKPTPIFFKASTQLGLKMFDSCAELLSADGGDITRWLLHYWQWPALTRAFGQVYRESIKMRSLRERAELTQMDVMTSPRVA